LIGFPRSPFVGELSYGDIVNLLRRQSRWFNRAERSVASDLTEFLEFTRQTQSTYSTLVPAEPSTS
jgi:hypothetical protein